MFILENMADLEMGDETIEYGDLLPMMAEKLDSETFVSELCCGFRLLADPMKGMITSESLRKNSALMGLVGMNEEESKDMIREGDLDGDGTLNEMEFCVLMVRLSPDMMQEAAALLDEAIQEEIVSSSVKSM